MFGARETKGLSEEEAFKKYLYDLTDMVRVLYEERNTKMDGESSKSPHGEGSSKDKRDEKNDSNGNGGKPPPYPPSFFIFLIIFIILIITNSIIFHSTTKTIHTHSQTPKGKTPLLKLEIKFEIAMYNGEVNVEKLYNWI